MYKREGNKKCLQKFDRKSHRKRPLRTHRCEENIKMHFRKEEYKSVSWIEVDKISAYHIAEN
jgi:hypothetical protein